MQKITQFIASYPRWIALIAGAASATGFAPLGLWPVTLVCFALFIHLVGQAGTGRKAAMIGWLFGVGHFTIGNNWIAVAFTFQAAMPAWLGWIAVVTLAEVVFLYGGVRSKPIAVEPDVLVQSSPVVPPSVIAKAAVEEPAPYSAAVAARFPAPSMVYSTPGLQAGRTTFTTQDEIHTWLRDQVHRSLVRWVSRRPYCLSAPRNKASHSKHWC